jgi:chaperone required for assembly of F1-ATPase
MSHIPPLDPNVAARKGFRDSEERLKRFWKAVDVVEGEGGWAVTLDGRTPKTPAHAPLRLPTEAAARLAAEEWAAQGEFIDPATMPATRLASTAIDRVSQVREAVAEEIAAFAGTDLLCYLAEHPTSLVGSAVLALALQQGEIGGEAAYELSRLDEAFQERLWGVDAEAAERTAARRAEAVLLDRWFRALD